VAVLNDRPPAGPAPRFPLLDPVRAIAALSVLVYHAATSSKLTDTGSVMAPILDRLDAGIAVFFLLSGFLLYRPFVRARLFGTPEPGAGAYGWRRFLRIVPAYWLALTVVALVIPKPDVFEPAHALVYYGFAQNYTDLALGGLGQAWTLCIEVTFYALLPVWAVALRRLRVPATVRAELLALAGLALFSVVWNVVAVTSAPDPDHANAVRMLVWLPAFLDHFAIGMALAVLSVAAERDGRLPRPLAWLEHRAWPAWLLALVAFLLVAYAIGLSPENPFFAKMTALEALSRHWLYAVVGLGIVLPAAFGPARRGAIRRLLGHSVLIRLGLISYGIYLWHFMPLLKLTEWRPSLADGGWSDFGLLLAAGFVVSVAAASLSWRLVERPLLRLKRLVPDRALPARDPVTHVAEPPAPVPAAPH
jgi:peptidoglycan/LPS O-acetylase OafA/YrhL